MKFSTIASTAILLNSVSGTYPNLPVDDWGYCVQTTDCRTSTFKCCTVTKDSSTTKLCVNSLQGTAPNGITVTVPGAGSSMDLSKGVISCTSADSAYRLMATTSAALFSLYMLY